MVFFQVFQHGAEQLLSRVWMLDPVETQTNAAVSATTTRAPWDGEFYVSFGDPASRSWVDAREYGLISAGSKPWYTRTLSLLEPGDRIWVKIPGTGFVGVGRVTGPVTAASEFKVITSDGSSAQLVDVSNRAAYHRHLIDDPDTCEYFVPVEWLHTVDEAHAVNEIGMSETRTLSANPPLRSGEQRRRR